MEKIKESVKYFDKHVGHFTDLQKIDKIKEEVEELKEALIKWSEDEVIDECSDVMTVAFHIATRNGYEKTPNDLFLQAYQKMKKRIENGERDYKNGDF